MSPTPLPRNVLTPEAFAMLQVTAETWPLCRRCARFVFAVAPQHPFAGVTESLTDDLMRQYRVVALADWTRKLMA